MKNNIFKTIGIGGVITPVIIVMGHIHHKFKHSSNFFIHPLKFALLLIFACNVSNSNAQISILNEGTSNPTLIYKGKPLLKLGPLPETALFSVKWGSSGFPHEEWLDWMAENRLGYGRVYPESAFKIGGSTDTEIAIDHKDRLFPFKVVKWKDGQPLVDITRLSPDYWENFARVINECGKSS